MKQIGYELYYNLGDYDDIEQLPKSVRLALAHSNNIGTARPEDLVYIKYDKPKIMSERIRKADEYLSQDNNLNRIKGNAFVLHTILTGHTP